MKKKKTSMIIPSWITVLVNFFCIAIFILNIPMEVLSQTKTIKGTVKDELTLKVIQDVNIQIIGTAQGTSTNKIGLFSLSLNSIPAELLFTCIGYETVTFIIDKVPEKTIEFHLRPKSYKLPEVDISSKKYSFLFKDKDYSILDYEIWNENLLLLVFRYQIKQSELVLLTRSGDTLDISKVPESPPGLLFKDFLLNVHYITKNENAYQCYYNVQEKRIEFFPMTNVDTLKMFTKPFIFKINDRLYFQETIESGFGTTFGFYEKGIGKKYIKKVINDLKISESIDDLTFYRKWNKMLGKSNILAPDDIESNLAFDFSSSRSEGGAFGKNEARAHQFEFFNMIYPVVKTRNNNIAFFNFATDTLELMNKNGNIINTVPIFFHKEYRPKFDTSSSIKLSDTDWHWGNTIILDEYSNDVYTTFKKNGMVKVQKVEIETGKLKSGIILPFPFPEKIEIYNGTAFFLIKSDGSNDNWKLVKCNL